MKNFSGTTLVQDASVPFAMGEGPWTTASTGSFGERTWRTTVPHRRMPLRLRCALPSQEQRGVELKHQPGIARQRLHCRRARLPPLPDVGRRRQQRGCMDCGSRQDPRPHRHIKMVPKPSLRLNWLQMLLLVLPPAPVVVTATPYPLTAVPATSNRFGNQFCEHLQPSAFSSRDVFCSHQRRACPSTQQELCLPAACALICRPHRAGR
mmetsp:Transcript_44172/g.71852  ORF Transcript_44172/g.71852 Transcript_44172/m.71852 type:complete len:208 (+) Transcript_44172:37-660(+)